MLELALPPHEFWDWLLMMNLLNFHVYCVINSLTDIFSPQSQDCKLGCMIEFNTSETIDRCKEMCVSCFISMYTSESI